MALGLQPRDMMSTSATDTEKLCELLDGVHTCMMGTLGADGYPHSCPMTLRETDRDGHLWFFLHGQSEKLAEIRRHNRIDLAVQSGETYVSIGCHAVECADRDKAEELWRPGDERWFPGGIDDEDLVVLRLTVLKAEYWDSPGGMARGLFDFAKSLITGHPAGGRTHGMLGAA